MDNLVKENSRLGGTKGSPCLQAVVEAPFYEDAPLFPWAIANHKPFSPISLHGDMTHEEVGLIFSQLVNYNGLESQGNVNKVLHQVLESEALILPGGIQAKKGAAQVISPSCCCGLESWRDWWDFLKTGQSPWLGHDPSPWIEIADGVIRVWSILNRRKYGNG